MTPEEAGEIVLGGGWIPCPMCEGEGCMEVRKSPNGDGRMNCRGCERKGFILTVGARRAYQMLGAALPPKPLTPMEQLGKAGADMIRERMMLPAWQGTLILDDPFMEREDP